MDIFESNSLTRVVNEYLKPVPQFFLDRFFPSQMVSEAEVIYFDVTTNNRQRITPFVSPLHQGKLIEDQGYTTESFKPAYVKDLRVLNPLKALKRRAGEPFGGGMSMQQRAQMVLMDQLQDQNDMLNRRLEVMAVEAILTGKQTVIGEGVNAVVDFGRDSDLTFALTLTDKWDDSGNTSQANMLEDWSQILLEKSGSGTGVIIMDAKAWKLFKRTKDFDTVLDKSNRLSDSNNIDLSARFAFEGASYKGNFGDFELWVYSGEYVDNSGTTKKYIPDNTVLLIGNVDGVRHFGSILDLDSLQAVPKFVKSWVQQDPSVRFTLLQSAPLLVPYRKNAVVRVTVA